MKVITKLAAAAVLVLSFGAKDAEAGPLTIGTTMGTFSLPAINGVDGYDAGTATESFNLFRGSFLDANGGVEPVGFGKLTTPWSADATGSIALTYATAFASAIETSVLTRAALEGQDSLGFFAPIFPASGFVTAAYAFAYDIVTPIIGEKSLTAVVVEWNGTEANVLSGITITGDSPDFSDDTSTLTGSSGIGALYYASDPSLLNVQNVPEIDGPVLAQVGFALGGLYLLMLGRRRRNSVDMSQAA